MKKYTGFWLKRARNKAGLLQKELSGDRFTRSYISMVEIGEAGLSTDARLYITRKLKLPKSYFDSGLFTDEKKELEKLIKAVDILTDYQKYEEAKSFVLKALSIIEEVKNDNYKNIFLLKLARINILIGEFKKAKDDLNEVIRYFEEEKDFENLAYANYWTGILHLERKNYEDAVFLFNKAIEENSKQKKLDLSLKARSLVGIAQIYRHIENYKGAKVNSLKAIKIAKKSKDDYILAMSYWEYSLLLHRDGKYQEAIKYYDLAAPIYKKLGYERLYLGVIINLMSLYHYIKDYDKTIKLTSEIIKISEDKKYEKELAYALLNGAKAKRDKGSLDESESDLKKAIILFEKLKDNRMLGEAHMALALLYERKKENDLAIKNFNKATNLFKELIQPTYILSSYGEIIEYYKNINNLNKEREYTKKLINKIKRIKF